MAKTNKVQTKEIPVEEKEKSFKERIKIKMDAAKDSIKDAIGENPEIIISTLISGTIAITVGICKTILDMGRISEDCLVTDDITGCDYLVDHPLTNEEILYFGERISNGESRGEALQNMGVLVEEKKRHKVK